MKFETRPVVFFLLILACGWTVAQEPACSVLKPELVGSYSGDCKKGLANGKGVAVGTDTYEGRFKDGLPNGTGTYKYANGEVYVGDFKAGKREGTGKFTFRHLNRDSTFLGIWKGDSLVKKVLPAAWRITQSYNVQRYNVQKLGDGNQVVFSFVQNGNPNYSVSGLTFVESSGTALNLGRDTGFSNILFPFECKVNYSTSNSLRTSTYEVIFEIQINEPGKYLITISNL